MGADEAMTLDTYLQELADPSTPLTVSKLVNLSGMGPAEASQFFDAWMLMDDARRRSLVRELAELAEDNVELNFDAVFMIALADQDADVRRTSVQGLWEYEGRDLLDPLIGLLQSDPDAGVRAEAALALGRFALKAEFAKLRSHDADKVDQALGKTVQDESEIAEVRGRALEALGARSEPWVRELIKQSFDNGDRRLRISAVHAMGRNCDASWLAYLEPELESDDAELRFEAAGAVGSIGEESSVESLVPLLDDEDVEVQRAAIDALGQIGGEPAKKALKDLLERDDDRLREPALEALAEADFEDDPLGFRVRG